MVAAGPKGAARVLARAWLAAAIVASPAVCGPGPAWADDDLPGAEPLVIEGPGYGGTADELGVRWVRLPVSLAAAPIGAAGSGRPLLAALGAGPGSEDGGPRSPDLLETGDSDVGLAVEGVGFRGKSAVTIRVGESDPVRLRTDPTGTLAVQVAGVVLNGVTPGMSVVAIGRSPSGTTRTLVGAVPPRPGGLAPSDVIPWLAALGGLVALGWQVHRRRSAGPATGAGLDDDADPGEQAQPEMGAAGPQASGRGDDAPEPVAVGS